MSIGIKATKANATLIETEKLTSGRVGLPIYFEFSSDWDGLGATAVFKAGSTVVEKVLTVTALKAEDTVPWEVLSRARVNLVVGVRGVKVNAETGYTTTVIPTVYCACGDVIEAGTESGESDNSVEVTASDRDQMLSAMETAIQRTIAAASATVDTSSVAEGNPSCVPTLTDVEGGQRLDLAFSHIVGRKGDTGNGIEVVAFLSDNRLAIYETNGTVTYFDGIKDGIKALSTLEETVSTNETTRQGQEESRQTAEGERVNAEIGRATAETERQRQETEVRQANENARVAAETARATAENTRSGNESQREQNETVRKNNETARQTNETNRETAETARVNAETARVTEWNDLSSEIRVAAQTATDKADAASKSASDASGYATNAAGSASDANGYASSASTSRIAAETARTNAESAQTKAETAQSKAEAAQYNAEDYASKAMEYRNTASGYADAAETSAERAEQVAVENGYAVFYTDSAGHCHCVRTTNIAEDVDFKLVNGRLVVELNG